MRTLRLSPAGTVVVALIGGMATVAAQSEGDDARLETLSEWAHAQSASTGSLSGARQYHTATLLPDGRVLVVGGDGAGLTGSDVTATAEVWEPPE